MPRYLLILLLLAVAAGTMLGVVPAPGRQPDLARAAKQVKEIIAHRGSSSDCPENTLASYRRAIAVGANAVEVDVRTTRDGVLVSLHDADVSRTTNGKGTVNQLTLAELQRLDAGSWFAAKFKAERVPTLRAILELCQGKAAVLLDIKETGDDYLAKIATEVRKHGSPRETLVGVRSVEQARLFRKLLPEARQIGLIPTPDTIDAFAQAGVETIRLWPRWLTDAALVPAVRKHKLQLHIGAPKGTREEVLAILPHQPESISSDDPARLRQTLAEIAGK